MRRRRVCLVSVRIKYITKQGPHRKTMRTLDVFERYVLVGETSSTVSVVVSRIGSAFWDTSLSCASQRWHRPRRWTVFISHFLQCKCANPSWDIFCPQGMITSPFRNIRGRSGSVRSTSCSRSPRGVCTAATRRLGFSASDRVAQKTFALGVTGR
jgi:hypothetical protein